MKFTQRHYAIFLLALILGVLTIRRAHPIESACRNTYTDTGQVAWLASRRGDMNWLVGCKYNFVSAYPKTITSIVIENPRTLRLSEQEVLQAQLSHSHSSKRAVIHVVRNSENSRFAETAPTLLPGFTLYGTVVNSKNEVLLHYKNKITNESAFTYDRDYGYFIITIFQGDWSGEEFDNIDVSHQFFVR